jgi:hypothetical protein
LSTTQIEIQTLNTDYFGHNFDIGSVSANNPDRNITNLNISIVNGQLHITWDDCLDTHWSSNMIIKAKNYIPASTYNEGIIERQYTKNGHSLMPLIDTDIQVNTLYCYRIFSEYGTADDLYSGFKNIFFVYTYDPAASGGTTIGNQVIDATMILLDSNHRFVTDSQILAWNSKADQATTYTKTEVNSLITSNLAGVVTTTQNGLMSSADKIKLNGLSNYVHPATHPASMITGLSLVATSGNYNDLINKPTIPTVSTAGVTGNYNDLTNKPTIPTLPTLATVATTGSYTDLTNKPALSTVAFSGNYADLTNKPSGIDMSALATVATTGSYTDLTNKPALSTVATSGNYNDLLNKPSLPTFATVATTGNYNDLINKPTIPVFSTVAVSGSYNDLLNKPTLATVATTGSYNDLLNKPTIPTTFATVATTGSYNDLLNTPTLAPVATTGNYNSLLNKPTLATVASTGSYNDLTNKPTIPVVPTLATVATTGSYTDLLNKPTIPVLPTLATVATSGDFNDLKNIPAAYTTLATVAKTGSYFDLIDTPVYAAVAASGSYTDLVNKPSIPTIIAKGSSTFAGSAGVTISIPTQTSTNYIVNITPSGASSAANPGGALGEVYVVKSTTTIKVYNSGTARTTFDYFVM